MALARNSRTWNYERILGAHYEALGMLLTDGSCAVCTTIDHRVWCLSSVDRGALERHNSEEIWWG